MPLYCNNILFVLMHTCYRILVATQLCSIGKSVYLIGSHIILYLPIDNNCAGDGLETESHS